MDFENRYDGINDYTSWLIRHKAKQLIGSAGFTKSDLEDIEQELILDLLQRLPKFDSNKAGYKTFIARVVDHRIARIIEERKAGLRDWRLCITSLNDIVPLGEGVCGERLEAYDMDEYLRQIGCSSRNSSDRLELSIDIGMFVNSIKPELRTLCERLKTESVTEISRDTGIPRATLYERIQELRDLLEDNGLKEYI